MQAGEMSYDADLLAEMIDNGTPPKGIAQVTDLSVNTIYAYRNGKIRIPVGFWRRLYAATRDPRIPALVVGDQVFRVVPEASVPDLTDDVASLRGAIESIGKFHELQSHLADIIADGKINADDAAAVREYNGSYAHFVTHGAAIHRAINKAFDQATHTKERTR